MSSDESAKILICDYLAENLTSYQAILDELGQDLVLVRSGEEALKEVLKHDFAVILLDVNMPGIDGLETASLIRGRKRSSHTPIIFITAFTDELRVSEGYAHGAVDYISSPVVPTILRAKVRVFVELWLMTREARRTEAERMTQGMIEALPNPVFLMGSNGRYRGVNRAWEALFSIERGGAIRPCSTLRSISPRPLPSIGRAPVSSSYSVAASP